MSCINPVSTPLPQILWRPFFFILWIQKEFSPLLPLRLDWMFLNLLPNSAPLFSFSAFLMEISLYTSNITSTLLELDPSCSAKLHVGHLSKHLVVSYESLYKGHSIYYKCWWLHDHVWGWNTSFSILLPKLPSLFFLMLHQQWIMPRKGAQVDDSELPSFKVFCCELLISSWPGLFKAGLK